MFLYSRTMLLWSLWTGMELAEAFEEDGVIGHAAYYLHWTSESESPPRLRVLRSPCRIVCRLEELFVNYQSQRKGSKDLLKTSRIIFNAPSPSTASRRMRVGSMTAVARRLWLCKAWRLVLARQLRYLKLDSIVLVDFVVSVPANGEDASSAASPACWWGWK